jgi:hypothetical protein
MNALTTLCGACRCREPHGHKVGERAAGPTGQKEHARPNHRQKTMKTGK